MDRTTTLPPRAPSPASGSPLRHDAGLAEYEEGCEAVHGHRLEDITLERAKGEPTIARHYERIWGPRVSPS